MDKDLLVLIVSRTMLLGLVCLMLWGMTGCGHGRWSETALMIEGDKKQPAHWLVARVEDNYRVFIQQPQIVTYSHCTQKRSSEELARLRYPGTYRASGYAKPIEFEGADTGGFVSDYRGCTDIISAQVNNGQSIFSQVAGPGAIVGGAYLIQRGLARSGDTITQQGGGAQSNATATGGAGGMGGKGGVGMGGGGGSVIIKKH